MENGESNAREPAGASREENGQRQGLLEEHPQNHPPCARRAEQVNQTDGIIDNDVRDHQTMPLLHRINSTGSGRVQSVSGTLVDLSGVVADVEEWKDKEKAQNEEIMKLHDLEGEQLLPEDTYSFLAITREDTSCRRPGWSFLLGIGVLLFQAFTLSLLAVDTVDRDNDGNKLNIPGGVETQVRLAQLVAVIITVISQDEVRQSLNVIYCGYDPDVVSYAFGREINANREPGCSSFCSMRFRWYFSIALRLIAGILGLAVTFMLLITQDSVRELLLNFTAVEFVSNVDDAVFLLCKWGYFGDSMKTDADAVADAKWGVDKQDETEAAPLVANGTDQAESLRQRSRKAQPKDHKLKRLPAHSAGLFLTFIGMLIAWLILSLRQQEGDYLTSTVYVQFGDEFSATLGTFSGIYMVEPRGTRVFGHRRDFVATTFERLCSLFSAQRVDYVAVGGSARFRYCKHHREWVFLYGNRSSTYFDECNDVDWIRAVSSETYTFDLSKTVEAQWFWKDTDTNRSVPMQHFSLSQRTKVVGQDCKEGESDGFKCQDGKWVCKEGIVGESCQFPRSLCTELEIDERYHPAFADARSWSLKYDIALKDSAAIAQAYGRPIYIGDVPRNGDFDVMFFVGRRWVLTSTDRIHGVQKTRRALIDFLAHSFHAHWANFSVVFISEPVDVDTPADVPTPVGLNWFHAEVSGGPSNVTLSIQVPDQNREDNAVLLCAICNNSSNPCLFEGICSFDGKCRCTHGTLGARCQITPEGDGQCNPYFNTPGYGWDGGDCCPNTCKSDKYRCGVEGSNVGLLFPSLQYVGFPYCMDPSQLCDTNTSCWKKLVDIPGSDGHSRAGEHVALSGEGSVVAIYEFCLHDEDSESVPRAVRVFEQDGFQWVERKRPLPTSDTSVPIMDRLWNISSLISLSDDGKVVSIVDIVDEVVRVYRWETAPSESWVQLGGDFQGKLSTHLSRDGRTLAVGGTNKTGGGLVHNVTIFRDADGKGWSKLGSDIVIGSSSFRDGFPLSLSNDGLVVAVGHSFNRTVGVYKYTAESWSSIGPSLSQEGGSDSYSVTLSGDGTVLAVGNPTRALVYVFEYDATALNWSTKGTPFTRDLSSSLGASVSLSEDAQMLAIGVPFLGSQAAGSDHLEVFQYVEDSGSWIRFGEDLSITTNDNSGVSVSLSRDGSVLAFGAPAFNRGISGATRVVWNTKTKTSAPPNDPGDRPPPNSEVTITFEIQLDSFPWQTRLSLKCDGRDEENYDYGYWKEPSNEPTLSRFTVVRGATCIFTIEDENKDGICCDPNQQNGYYKVYFGDLANDENLIANGGRLFGSRENITFKAQLPTSLVPITFEITLDTEGQQSVALNLTCSNEGREVLELNAPRGTFRHSQFSRKSTFFLPKGAVCNFCLENDAELVPYKIIHGRDLGEDRLDNPASIRDGKEEFKVPGCERCKCKLPDPKPPPPGKCGSGKALFRFVLKTDEFETIMLDISFRSLATATNHASNEDEHAFPSSCEWLVWENCVPVNADCIQFDVVNVTNDESTCCNGGLATYEIIWNNVLEKKGANFCDISFVRGDCPTVSPSIAPTTLSLLPVPTMAPSNAASRCPEGQVNLHVEIVTDLFPQDTIWNITSNGEVLLKGGPYRDPKYRAVMITSNKTCVPEDACLVFTIWDLSGNGLCCKNGNGKFSIFLDGILQVTNDSFAGDLVRVPVGDCSVPPNATESLRFDESRAPSPSPKNCADGFAPLRLQLNTDRNPHELLWSAYANDTLIMQNELMDQFEDAFKRLTPLNTCVPDDACIKFYLYDSRGDGICCDYGEGSYSIYYDGVLKETVRDFGSDREISMGPCGATDPTSAPRPPPLANTTSCEEGFKLFSVEILFDQYPAEILYWLELLSVEETSIVVQSDQFDGEKDALTNFTSPNYCIRDSGCYTFSIIDRYGDGLCCDWGEGYYKLYYDKAELFHGRGDFGDQTSFTFGDCQAK